MVSSYVKIFEPIRDVLNTLVIISPFLYLLHDRDMCKRCEAFKIAGS